MIEFVRSIQSRDPANPTFMEVVLGYNGFHAALWHRLNYALWRLKLRAVARLSANIMRILTGVEIHPQAQIGKRLFIDHGMGCVIGQTVIIGDDVTLYHGVTLGGVGQPDADGRRHPRIEDGVMIGSGAQILGTITIGRGAKIGSNSVVVQDIPEGCTAIGIPAKIVCKKGDSVGLGTYGMPAVQDWVI
ncbi:MAG: serine O-acetyltransferase [Alphaproteobacteria bacterium]